MKTNGLHQIRLLRSSNFSVFRRIISSKFPQFIKSFTYQERRLYNSQFLYSDNIELKLTNVTSNKKIDSTSKDKYLHSQRLYVSIPFNDTTVSSHHYIMILFFTCLPLNSGVKKHRFGLLIA